MSDTGNSITKMSFEAAMDALDKIVKDLENGKTGLEESITAYERGIALKNHCEAKLKEAQARIDKIIVKSDGSLSTAPLDS